MSYATVIEGLHERFATVDGLSTILDYEPTSVHGTPLLYSFLDRLERSFVAQLTVTKYRIVHRLLIPWADPEGAEKLATPLIDAIPLAVDADMQLGGRLPRGVSQIVDAVASFYSVGGTKCLAIDFASETVQKEPRP